MPENNKKQAMLPEGAEFIDNPIGTACGFAVDIGEARFYFTPGVPKELYRMLDEQVIPRLQKIRGIEIVTRVKRFHTFGIGESRADQMLHGIEEMVPEKRVKLGFQSHYPQLETKLTAQGESEESLDQLLQPVEAAVRERLGNFIICEDNQTMEGNILAHLESIGGSVSVGEMHSAGEITLRLLSVSDYSGQVRRGIISLDYREIGDFLGLEDANGTEPGQEQAGEVAGLLRKTTEASHGLAVLVSLVPADETGSVAGDVFIGISDGESVQTRVARLPGNPGWIRAGASEMGLDCLRRFLFGQPVHEMIDFEQH
jgi:nicotinamide-nucleotide amidase